jgi:hypothetical protein
MRRKVAVLFLLILSLSLAAEAAVPPPVPRGPEIRLETDPASFSSDPEIAAFPDGGFVVVWRANDGFRARFLDARGRRGREILLPANGFGHDVATTNDGFLLAWATSTPSSPATGIFVRRFDRAGRPQGKRIRVSNLSTSERHDPVIASAPGGRFAVAWTADVQATTPEGDPYTYSHAVGRIFSAAGTPVTGEIVLQEGLPATDAGDDAVDASSRGLVLKPDGALLAQVHTLGASGCFQSYLVQMLPGEEPEVLDNLNSGFCNGPPYRDGSAALVMRPDGGVIAAWSDAGEVQAQVFAADGTPRGEWFRVSQNPDALQYAPVIAVQAGGRFVIAWAEDDQSGQPRSIFGRSFTANGTPRTETYQINVTTEGSQSEPSIAAARQGPIVTVWTQALDETSDIAARLLLPRQ